MKHIIFGGFDYAVYFEMNADSILKGVDYFVDNDPALIGTSYLGKEIKDVSALLEEDKNDILILIGSIVYRTELMFQLVDMGFEEYKHFVWAISFTGDEKCPRLWRHIEWNDHIANEFALKVNTEGEMALARLKIVARMIDFNQYDNIIDLGAANERIRAFLPEKTNYIPVDYIKYSNSTILCDLNRYEFPDIDKLIKGYYPENTCIISIANLQYCGDWKWYLQTVSQHCSCFIYSRQDFARATREWRRTHAPNNALFSHEVILYMQKCGFQLTDAVDFRLKSTIFKFLKLK